jgi:hypothetical protein
MVPFFHRNRVNHHHTHIYRLLYLRLMVTQMQFQEAIAINCPQIQAVTLPQADTLSRLDINSPADTLPRADTMLQVDTLRLR